MEQKQVLHSYLITCSLAYAERTVPYAYTQMLWLECLHYSLQGFMISK